MYHRLYPHQNDSLIELLLMLDALKQVGAKVFVVAPYLPYARQDKIHLEGEVGSAKVICNLLASAGCHTLITFDAHFLDAEGEFVYEGLKIRNISMGTSLIAEAENLFNGEDFELVAPDDGATYLFGGRSGKWIQKTRADEHTDGKNAYRGIAKMQIDFDAVQPNVLIIDDMISTGGTIIRCMEELKKRGAKRIVCASTHGLFLNNSLERIQSLCESVLVTDSIISPVSRVTIKDKLAGMYS